MKSESKLSEIAQESTEVSPILKKIKTKLKCIWCKRIWRGVAVTSLGVWTRLLYVGFG